MSRTCSASSMPGAGGQARPAGRGAPSRKRNITPGARAATPPAHRSLSAALAACSGPLASLLPTPVPSSPPNTASPGPSPTPSQFPTEPPTPSPASDPAVLRRKAARLLVVGFRGLTIGPHDPITKALGAGLGGVILFDRERVLPTRNTTSPSQLKGRTPSLRAASS